MILNKCYWMVSDKMKNQFKIVSKYILTRWALHVADTISRMNLLAFRRIQWMKPKKNSEFYVWFWCQYLIAYQMGLITYLALFWSTVFYYFYFYWHQQSQKEKKRRKSQHRQINLHTKWQTKEFCTWAWIIGLSNLLMMLMRKKDSFFAKKKKYKSQIHTDTDIA